MNTPTAQAPIICECGHEASHHHNGCVHCSCPLGFTLVMANAVHPLAARVAELEAAMRDYFSCIDYDRETAMHDNYTDRARNRKRIAETEREARRLLGGAK